jgi:methyl-accepting chemotaxis protein
MDKVTQQNAAGAEECASASEELSAQAETVKGMVDELTAVVSGSGRDSRAAVSTARATVKTANKPHFDVKAVRLHKQPPPAASPDAGSQKHSTPEEGSASSGDAGLNEF